MTLITLRFADHRMSALSDHPHANKQYAEDPNTNPITVHGRNSDIAKYIKPCLFSQNDLYLTYTTMTFNIFHHKKHSRPSSPQVGSTEDLGHHTDPTHTHSGTHDHLKADDAVRSNPPSRSESPALTKFLADPMRSSPKPEHVGGFEDPMGGSINQAGEKDPMSTGA
ncbi:unnamed protein product [Umbelopsis ramanniana]